jgi:hypothetical protein
MIVTLVGESDVGGIALLRALARCTLLLVDLQAVPS